ncbi:MAG: formate/nitrite transporter family protein [Methylocystis sp.]
MDEAKTEPSGNSSLTEREVIDIEDRAQPRAPVIYEVVRRQGDEELSRPCTSLWWSGVAAGLSMSFSLLAQCLLHVRLPDASWRPLIETMGYPVGFLMVILSRQQLFTENTITVVLPVMREPSAWNFWRLARLWSVVFLANMAGTLISAVFCEFAPALTPEVRAAMLEISREMMANPPSHMFFKGIGSGFLIATMVWAIPSAEAAKFHIVALITYLIAVSGFTHIVADSMEAFLLMVNGELAPSAVLLQFILPVLCGNIVGGAALFALISHAQVMNEM